MVSISSASAFAPRQGTRRPWRRWVSVFLLLLFSVFLATSGVDNCHEDTNPHHQQSQHILCIDDCAPALVPQPPTAPPPDPVPAAVYTESLARPILTLELEPEKEPPRA